MRVFATVGCTLAGLALLASSARAQQPVARDANGDPVKSGKSKSAMHLCGKCQRLVLQKRGVHVPPPPPLPPGAVVKGASCGRCGAATQVVAGNMPPVPSRSGGTPGRAVVGGPMPAPAAFVSNGVEPMPIGMVAPRMAAARPPAPAGSRDGSVTPTAMASDPVRPPGHNHPRVISHLFGLDALGKERAERRERSERESHASIPYGGAAQPVTDVPASMVYGKH